MYDLHLTVEQLEFRETVRDFVDSEVKPAALSPKRLEPFDKPLLLDVLEKASQMGLRSRARTDGDTGAHAVRPGDDAGAARPLPAEVRRG